MKTVRPEDIFGCAVQDYWLTKTPQNITTETDISEADDLPVIYLFREFEAMPPVEQKALQLAAGSVLDVGCGAGSHALYLQNDRQLDVLGLDSACQSVDIAAQRGLRKTVCVHLLQYEPDERFDTIMLLMNGTGIFESLSKIDRYLEKLSALLADGGQVLIDGTDILYMFDQEADGSYMVPADQYYGEVLYKMTYKNMTTEFFPWLYLDFNTLSRAANHNGFLCELVVEDGPAYLARLTKV